MWCFDRALRIGRLISLNLPKLEATATYNREANTIRVTVPTRKLLRPRPGTYYFVYFFHGIKPWESHPFTMKSWASRQSENDSRPRQVLEFIVRPHNGLTAGLRKHLLLGSMEGNGATFIRSIKIAVEGPYGTPCDISQSSSILFIVGGNGITVALSHLQALHGYY